MNKNSKVWNTTRTGFKVHAFNTDGKAMCHSSIKDSNPSPAHAHSTARRWVLDTPGLSFCDRCEARFEIRLETQSKALERAHAEALEINATPRALVAPEQPACICPVRTDYHDWKCQRFQSAHVSSPCCEHAPMYHGARGCDECGCTMPRTHSGQACTCPPSYAANDYHDEHCPVWAPDVIDNIEENHMTTKTPPLKAYKWKGALTPLQHRILRMLAGGMEHAAIAEQIGFSRPYVSENVCAAAAKMHLPTTAAAVARYATYQAHLAAAELLLDKGLVAKPSDPAEEHVNHVVEMLSGLLRERAERLMPQ